MEKEQKNDISKMNFEKAVDELTEIVSNIEDGEISLQQSLEKYERGMNLIKHCREILSKAEQRIEKISKPKQEET
jgi:exodeoxyribonuclease VII small subunit